MYIGAGGRHRTNLLIEVRAASPVRMGSIRIDKYQNPNQNVYMLVNLGGHTTALKLKAHFVRDEATGSPFLPFEI